MYSSGRNTCTSQNDYCLICRDFYAVDAHAGNYPRQYVTSIPILAFELCNPFVAKVDKARAIFTWLHHNIAYDTKAYFQNNVRHQSPKETLKTGLSVCQGYAELFQNLACHAGLEAIVISGHGKGYGYKSNSIDNLKNHSWNAVKLDSGQWQLVDPCWGAGSVDKNQNFDRKFKATVFTSSPETFRIKHFPSDPKYQFCKREMSWEEYVMVEDGPLIYDDFTDKEFSEVTIEPSCRIIKPEPTKFIITSKCPHTFILPEHQYVLLLCIDEVRTPFQVDSNGTTWMCESSSIKENSSVAVAVLETFGGRDGRGVTVDEYLKNNKIKGYSWRHICSWDVKK
ncbi:kyphoscoliosis peptidase-like [Bradysia coprophila]|uniref:kyphoscoliosis peptidase-like n=1 Tax=Bradysia coprophila TaxID=38358 RepID=UPI00187D79CF|nr:kyphoscoliosis peptidase-like [Bradysia coprophila]